jgi:hypothetical protein
MYSVTAYDLHCWYKAEFEKLGWMVLAKHEGLIYKLVDYKRGIAHLLAAIAEKVKVTIDEDCKRDLLILHKNTMTLRDHVAKDFKTPKKSTH